jgi:hypothetical protein
MARPKAITDEVLLEIIATTGPLTLRQLSLESGITTHQYLMKRLKAMKGWVKDAKTRLFSAVG